MVSGILMYIDGLIACTSLTEKALRSGATEKVKKINDRKLNIRMEYYCERLIDKIFDLLG
jgi:hypothetical protein